MAAVFLHYEQGSAPFTCKIKTELGLAEALEKFRTKYRKKHGREPPPLEARGHNDATWRALPAKTDVFLTEGKPQERPTPKPKPKPPAPPKPPPPPVKTETAPPALVARFYGRHVQPFERHASLSPTQPSAEALIV